MVVTEYEVALPHNMRLVFVSDFHFYPNEPIVNEILRISPDAVLVGGDFVHDRQNYAEGLDFLKSCAKHFPTFVSVGNHERRYPENLQKAVTECGAVFLDNSFAEFNGVIIGGLSSGYTAEQATFRETPMPNLNFIKSFAEKKGCRILLCHHPEYYEKYLRDTDIDLILSGHAHGGQWRIFGRGIFAPGQGLFPKYTSGIHDGRFIISRGLGNATRLPIIKLKIPRINNPPEILLLKSK